MTDPRPTSPAAQAEAGLAALASLRTGEGELFVALLELLDRLELPFAIKDLASGQYRHASARLAAVFGVTPERMIGSTDALEQFQEGVTTAGRAMTQRRQLVRWSCVPDESTRLQ